MKIEMYGVQEMDAAEMKETDGGSTFWGFVADYLIGKAIDSSYDALVASCVILSEGGGHCTTMPSK